ncbi:MAG: ABC transporter ATP-binding protein [Pseudohongiella sp.]|nr:MAG: ABC transporter ATP-binding protein [Pseudohongiella sp.]
MIEISNLTKKFNQFTAVNNLSFSVAEGEVLGFLGPNGAGKSTTMKILTGFLAPSSGTVRIDNYDISESPLQAKGLIGYLPEGAPSYGDMTVLEFLNFIANVRGYRGSEVAQRVERVINEVDLHSVANQTIETLSKGFKRRVGLAQAIMHDPKVLVLDEPTDGLDPNQKHHVRSLIKNLSQDKIVIISTHILEEVTAVCSRAIIIDQGAIVADGTPSELESRSRLHHAVSLTLESTVDLQADLVGVEGIEKIEQNPENALSFTILAKEGQTVFPAIANIARDKDWPVSELHVARGQLEDMFREVTKA